MPGREEVLMVTPIPPANTGLATYAMRVLRATNSKLQWTVVYPGGGDPSILPEGVRHTPIEGIDENRLPSRRIFQIGNSSHCFPVVRLLYRTGGIAILHETVLHHMLRDGYRQRDMTDEYRRELRFCFGPEAETVEKELSEECPEKEYDEKLKKYPLRGRVLHSSHSAVCLNEFSASAVRNAFPEGRVITVGHPLSALPDIPEVEKPFEVCIGMVGTNHPGRNLSELLAAMREIRKEHPEAGLVLIGSGYPSDLPEWCISTGRLDEPEYQGWIRTLDIAADLRHPTCGETSGSLLEVLRAGVPAVVSTSGAFSNLPSDGVIRVTPYGSVQGFVRAFRLLEGDPELRKTLSRKGREYALETGSEERLHKDWKRIIELAGENSGVEKQDYSDLQISPAWNEPPSGFSRDLTTGPVTWKFSSPCRIEGPEGAIASAVTAWGKGSVNGAELPENPKVMDLDGGILDFRGQGWVSSVLWKRR